MSKGNPATETLRPPLWRRRENVSSGGLERFGFALRRGRDVPAAIDDIWRTVVSGVRPRHFWHLREWYEHYARSIAKEELRFFIAYYYGRPIGILPLFERSRTAYGMRMRSLELPTHGHMPLSDLIVDTRFVSPDFFLRFERFLARQGMPWDMLVLQNVPADSCILRMLAAAEARHVVADWREYHCIRPQGGYDALARTLSSKTRENLRRARRRLEQAGAVEFVSASSGEALTAAFAAFLDIEASGWKGKEGIGSAIKLHQHLHQFYQGIMRAFAPGGGCRINVLKLDGQAIAAQFCLVVDDNVYALKIAYDEAYARLSPGKILLDEMLRRALAASRDVNLTSSAAWHADWRPREETAFKVTIFSGSWRGRVAYLLALAEAGLRALYRQYAPDSIRLRRSARRRARLARTATPTRRPGASSSGGGCPLP